MFVPQMNLLRNLFFSFFFFSLLEISLVCGQQESGEYDVVGSFDVSHSPSTYNDVLLKNVPFEFLISFSCFYGLERETEEAILWPSTVPYVIRMGEEGKKVVEEEGNLTGVVGGSVFVLRSSIGPFSTSLKEIEVEILLEGIDPSFLPIRVLDGWLSLLPPFVAVSFAIITRQVLLSLFLGIFLGSFLLNNYNPVSAYTSSTQFLVDSMTSAFNATMFLYLFFIGGVIGLVIFSGGIEQFAEKSSKYINTTRKMTLFGWGMGVFLFLSSLMSILLCGVSLKPIAEKLKVSKEKVAFILDTTASPVSVLIPISALFGYEVGLISDLFNYLDVPYEATTALYESIPFRLYPILIVFLLPLMSATRTDFGPMYQFELEKRGQLLLRSPSASQNTEPEDEYPSQREEDDEEEPILVEEKTLADEIDPILVPPDDITKKWWNAVLPLLVLVGMVLVGITVSGINTVERLRDDLNDQLEEAIDRGDPETVQSLDEEILMLNGIGPIYAHSSSGDTLLWASFLCSILTALFLMAQKILSLEKAVSVWVAGCKMMVFNNLILIFAWSIGNVCKAIHTGDFLVNLIGDSIDVHYLPLITFFLSAVISVSTGTSLGTMAIVHPLAVPLTWGLSEPGDMSVVVAVLASVLSGASFGDHCSPVSNTTILSASFSGCSIINHVITQAPYAVTMAVIAALFGYLPFGLQWYGKWVGLGVSLGVMVIVVILFGKRIPSYSLKQTTDGDSIECTEGTLDESCLAMRLLFQIRSRFQRMYSGDMSQG